jgi:hypothetical protein
LRGYLPENNHEIFFKEKERLAKEQSKNIENELKELEFFTTNFFIRVQKIIDDYQKKYSLAAKFISEKYNVFQEML